MCLGYPTGRGLACNRRALRMVISFGMAVRTGLDRSARLTIEDETMHSAAVI